MRAVIPAGRFGLAMFGTAAAVLIVTALATAPGSTRASELVDAARTGDMAAVQALIGSGADVSLAASDGSSALLWAVYQSHPEMVQALLGAGADVDAANAFGVTPLLQASRTGDVAIIDLLLDGGADPELAHPEGMTPLMAAALTGREGAVRRLLDAGADPNVADAYQEQTALMWAAAEGHGSVVAMLLEAGADPDLQARVTSLEERRNADFATGGFTALMWAVRNGHGDVVRQLAAAGANLDLVNGDDATATMIAIVNDRFDLAVELIGLGAGVDDGSLYYAVEMRDATTDLYARDGSRLRPDHDNEHTALDLVRILLEAGADPNAAFVGQMHSATMCCDIYANASPFYRAAVAADVESLKLMLAHGGDVEWSPARVAGGGGPQVNANVGKTPIMVAMDGGKGVPLSAGPGYSREGPPPFREPSNRTPADAVRLLLAAGADPDALTPDGETALHDAVRGRRLSVIRVLAEAGATLDFASPDGLTPLFLAENPLPEDNSNVFTARRDQGEASDAEIAAVLRDLMQSAGIEIEPATADAR